MNSTSKTNKTSYTAALARKLGKSNNKLLTRISKSLQRDKEYPMGFLIKKGISFFYRMFMAKIRLRKCDSVGKRTRVERKPYLVNLGEMHIGDNVNICSRNVPCDLVTYPGGSLSIADNTFVNFGTTICAKNKVSIGSGVKIGPYCMIHDTDFHIQGEDYKEAKGVPVIIEDNAWLGARVIMMKGSIVGKGSVIAAGSVVSGIIPPNVVAGGMPAKVIKRLKPKDDGAKVKNHHETGLAQDIKNEVELVLENVLGFKVNQLDEDTPLSEIPEWSAENHVLILETLKERFSLEVNDKDVIRLNELGKIYSFIKQSLSKQEHNQLKASNKS